MNLSHPEFYEIIKVDNNDQCFHCAKKPAQWASVNNAIFLCFECGGKHRLLGLSISNIKSITMDQWYFKLF